jgi:hypothetical protein
MLPSSWLPPKCRYLQYMTHEQLSRHAMAPSALARHRSNQQHKFYNESTVCILTSNRQQQNNCGDRYRLPTVLAQYKPGSGAAYKFYTQLRTHSRAARLPSVDGMLPESWLSGMRKNLPVQYGAQGATTAHHGTRRAARIMILYSPDKKRWQEPQNHRCRVSETVQYVRQRGEISDAVRNGPSHAFTACAQRQSAIATKSKRRI